MSTAPVGFSSKTADQSPFSANPQPAASGASCNCGPPQIQPIKTTPCEHQSLIVQCSHKGRKTTWVPTGPQEILQVVAGPASISDEITCITTIVKGPCDVHNNKVFDVEGTDPRPPLSFVLSKTNTQAKFKANSGTITESERLEFLWLPNAEGRCRYYNIKASTCTGPWTDLWVQAFPDLEWTVDLSASFKTSLGSDKEDSGSEYEFKGDIKSKLDGNTKEYKYGVGGEKGKPVKVLDWIGRVVSYVLDGLVKFSGTKLEFQSEGSISGNWVWKEIDGSPRCGIEGKLTIKLEPLIKVSIQQDVTKAFINIILKPFLPPPITSLLLEAYELGKSGKANYENKAVGAYLTGEVNLIGSGSVNASWAFSKNRSKTEWEKVQQEGSGSVSIGLSAELDGQVKGEILYFSISAGASFKASAEAKLTISKVKAVTKGGDVMLGAMIKFEGLTAKWSAVVKGTTKLANTEDEENDYSKSTSFGTTTSSEAKTGQGDAYTKSSEETSAKFSSTDTGISAEASKEHLYTIVGPYTWNWTDENDEGPPETKAGGPITIFRN